MMLWSQSHPGIYVDERNGPAFVHNCFRDLQRICMVELGQELIDLISKRCSGIGTAPGKSVQIKHATPPALLSKGRMIPRYNVGRQHMMAAGKDTGAVSHAPRGGGIYRSDTEVVYFLTGDYVGMEMAGRGANPVVVTYRNTAVVTGEDGLIQPGDLYRDYSGVTTPAFVALAHEPIHTFHFLSGTARDDDNEEEEFTIGLNRYAESRLTENALRRRLFLPVRTTHRAVA